MSPTSRSLKLLRDRGYIACVVEQTVPSTFIKRDAFGFGDILAAVSLASRDFWPSAPEVALVQTTSGSNLSARRTKILALPAAQEWLCSGGRIYLHGWRKVGKAGKRKLWECREQEITLSDFTGGPESHDLQENVHKNGPEADRASGARNG